MSILGRTADSEKGPNLGRIMRWGLVIGLGGGVTAFLGVALWQRIFAISPVLGAFLMRQRLGGLAGLGFVLAMTAVCGVTGALVAWVMGHEETMRNANTATAVKEGGRMFCRTCKNQVNEQAVACPKCGCPPLVGRKFCNNCGADTLTDAVLCTACGAQLSAGGGLKDWTIALLLCLLLGGFGAHRFYLGYTKIGVVQLALIVGGILLSAVYIGVIPLIAGGVWILLDLIKIIQNRLPDAEGKPLARK